MGNLDGTDLIEPTVRYDDSARCLTVNNVTIERQTEAVEWVLRLTETCLMSSQTMQSDDGPWVISPSQRVAKVDQDMQIGAHVSVAVGGGTQSGRCVITDGVLVVEVDVVARENIMDGIEVLIEISVGNDDGSGLRCRNSGRLWYHVVPGKRKRLHSKLRKRKEGRKKKGPEDRGDGHVGDR